MERSIYTVSLRGDDSGMPVNFFITDSPYGKLAVYFEEPAYRGVAYIGLLMSHDGKALKVTSVRPEEKAWINGYFMKGYDGKYLIMDWVPMNEKTPEDILDDYVLAMICTAYDGNGKKPLSLSDLRGRADATISHETLVNSLRRLAVGNRVDDYHNASRHTIVPLAEPAGAENTMLFEYKKLLVIKDNPMTNAVYRKILELWAAGESPTSDAIFRAMEENVEGKLPVLNEIVSLRSRGLIVNTTGDARSAVYAPVKAFIAPKRQKAIR